MSETHFYDVADMSTTAFVCFTVGIFVGFLLGRWCGESETSKDAVKAGVARYVAAEDGSSKFEWIVPSEKKP